MADEDRNTILARIAETLERWDDMAEHMAERVLQNPAALDTEERDMFSAAFKHALTSRRQAVRVAAGMAQAELEQGRPLNQEHAKNYQTKLEGELKEICGKVLRLCEESLIPTAAPGETATFFYKMVGDYNRYLAEVAKDDARNAVAIAARDAYQRGCQEAEGLSAIHSVRLGLALNYSVFQHEVLGTTAEAVQTAKRALLSATQALPQEPDAREGDAIVSMQLLQDNLQVWEPGN